MCEKAARIAELEREIAEHEQANADIELDGFSPAVGMPMRLANLKGELARLRNETPALTQGEGSEPVGWQPRRPEKQRAALPKASEWVFALFPSEKDIALHGGYSESRPLYASPPPLPAGAQSDAQPYRVTELDELRLIAGENADNVRLLDYISDKIGLPEDEELSQENFKRWFNSQSNTQHNADPRVREAFQDRVQPWMMACFGPEVSKDRVERNHRFLEESLELVQALGCTRSEAHQLVDYSFDREPGEPDQEVGGVEVTLAALCLANDLNMHEAGERELQRIWQKIDKIRAKQAAETVAGYSDDSDLQPGPEPFTRIPVGLDEPPAGPRNEGRWL